MMADVHDPKTRSYNMSRIRSKNTKPEVLVRKFLFAQGYRFRLYDKRLPGKPDIVLKKYKTVIFVHGCFWHSHKGCKYFRLPTSRQDYWIPKLEMNEQNDHRHVAELLHLGWKVTVVWECELKKIRIDKTLRGVLSQLQLQT